MQSVQKTTTIREEWDGHKEVRSLIEDTDEICTLYQKLGYSPYVEQMARRLLEKLNDIEVNILDFQGFQKSLDEVLVALEHFRSGQEKLNPLIFADSGLFEQVVESRRDKERILSLLNKNFREKLPIHIESSVIVRRPRDPDAFLSTLGELEKLFGDSWIPQSTETRNDLLEKIKEIREELQKENGDVLTALGSLNSEIRDTCFNIADEEANEKKRQLDELLWILVYTRHECKPQEPYFVEGVIKNVKKYWDNQWMHTPWLTRFALRHLLEAEIAKMYLAIRAKRAASFLESLRHSAGGSGRRSVYQSAPQSCRLASYLPIRLSLRMADHRMYHFELHNRHFKICLAKPQIRTVGSDFRRDRLGFIS
jgi:hypothetical protein